MATHLASSETFASGAMTSAEESDDTTLQHATDEKYLAGVAFCIRESIKSLETHTRRMVEAARTIGRNLMLAKKRVPYGEWETWIQQNTSLAPRTAQTYMKVAARLDELPPEEAQRVALLPLRDAVKAISVAANAKRNDRPPPCVKYADPAEESRRREQLLETLATTSAELNRFFEETSSMSEATTSRLQSLKRALTLSLAAVRDFQCRRDTETDDPTARASCEKSNSNDATATD